MSKISDLLVTNAENYISQLFAAKLPEKVIFHTFSHIMALQKHAETIGEHAGIPHDEMNLLRLCALFRDSGIVNSLENSREESIRLASEFLSEQGVDHEVIHRVSDILKPALPGEDPKDATGGLLADANMIFFISEGGLEQVDLLYDESAMCRPGFQKRSVFEKEFVEFLEKHSFYSEYGRTVLQPKKQALILRITARQKRRKMLDSKKEGAVKKKVEYSRGVDTMLRITARNQINLNSIADNKSNILISVNAIIISIIITMLAGNIGAMSQDIIPIIVLLVICLATIVIAILSTRPNIINNKFSREDLENKNVDLTFFGNFIKLEYDDYLKSVKDMMADEEHVYCNLIKNQYSLGKILSKKFRLVRIAYNVFMFGIIFTVIVFLLNYLIVH